MKKTALIMVMSLITFGIAGVALAGTQANQGKKFEGDVVNVNLENHTFTVKSGMEEMTFEVDPESHILIDDQQKLIGELEKGDHVTVTYRLENTRYIPERINRHLAKEILAAGVTFEGNIVAIDPENHTFTVRNQQGGQVEEMKFHTGVDSRVTIDGTRTLLDDLEKGDHVTVHYELDGDRNMVSHVQKHQKKDS